MTFFSLSLLFFHLIPYPELKDSENLTFTYIHTLTHR